MVREPERSLCAFKRYLNTLPRKPITTWGLKAWRWSIWIRSKP